jgi:phosphate transport system substrate-binding protein
MGCRAWALTARLRLCRSVVDTWVVGLVALFGCSHPQAPPPANVTAGAGEVLRLCGSATIGANLAPKLAEGFLRQLGAADAGVMPSKKKGTTTVSGHVDDRPVTVAIDHHGTSEAFTGLLGDSCDVGLASRPIQDDEIEKLRPLGDMTSLKAEHVLAMDGIAVIVKRSNRLTQLTVSQIAKVFSGEISDWADLGGAKGEIHVYARDERSGTYDTFSQLALGGKPLRAGTKRFDDNDALATAVARDEQAIGFVGLAAVGDTKALAVQDGDAQPSQPNTFSVATEEYPFSRRLFLYVSERMRSLLAQRFVDFAVSNTAESIVTTTGFVPLTVDAADPPVPASAPPAYVKATQGARRLSFVFRFRGAGTALDSRSSRDVGRLASFVATSPHPAQVSLLSFTDAGGTVSLARHRAQAVASLLKAHGVSTGAVEGFGPVMAIASNDNKEGRRKNNRVEVWLQVVPPR